MASKKLSLTEQAQEILRIAEESGVQSNYFFLTTFRRYQVQLTMLLKLEKAIKDEDMLIKKEYVKGRKNLYTNPAVSEYNKTTDSANKTVATLMKIIKNFNVDDNGILNIKGIKSDEDITTPDKPEVEDPIKGEVKDNILNITSTAKLFIEDGVLIINDSNVVEDGVIKL